MLARVLVMALCPRLCPRLYVTSRCSVETGGWNNLGVLAWGLLSTYPTLCYKEIQVSSK